MSLSGQHLLTKNLLEENWDLDLLAASLFWWKTAAIWRQLQPEEGKLSSSWPALSAGSFMFRKAQSMPWGEEEISMVQSFKEKLK